MIKNLAGWSGILGASLFLVASSVGGMQIEGYSHLSQFISESYAVGTPNAAYLQYFFMGSGLLLAIFAFVIPMVLPKSNFIRICFLLFGIFYGLGTVVTGFFPCDAGCIPDPVNPSISQFIHNTSGFLTYSVVPFCLIGLGLLFRKWPYLKKLVVPSMFCGFLSLFFVAFLFGDPTGPYIGLFQRIIEGGILFWVFYCSIFTLRKVKK